MKKKGLTHLIATGKAYLGGILLMDGKIPQINENAKFNEEAAIYQGFTRWQPQFLYISTDEEIKEGDWYYSLLVNKIGQRVISSNNDSYNSKIARKIVATDNPELLLGEWKEKYVGIPPKKSRVRFPNKNIAKIPTSFLKEYVEKQPKEVWLEYEKIQDFNMPYILKLKLNSSGEVIISPVEERMYTREEVFKILGEWDSYHCPNLQIPLLMKKWFDKNYPK